MAEPLKNFFSPALIERIGESIARVYPDFDTSRFAEAANEGLQELELRQRAQHIARALRATLPDDCAAAIDILVRSMGPVSAASSLDGGGMAPFFYMPHAEFISMFGLECYDASMQANYELTQRFTAEFSIRAFIDADPDRAMRCLERWVDDPNVHVRRLVSEGTRPRLPWASRLELSRTQPAWALPLLERLRDDPELYVRRSVANHLNDIGKQSPELLVDICRQWSIDATPERAWLIKHALRHSVKKGNNAALGVLGFGDRATVEISHVELTPAVVSIGNNLKLRADITNRADQPATLAIDVVVDFVKSGQKISPKVFKGTTATLAPGATTTLRTTISFKVHTTRRPYPGRHAIGLLVNGQRHEVGAVDVVEEAASGLSKRDAKPRAAMR